MYGILHFRVLVLFYLSFFFFPFILVYYLHSACVTYARVIPNDGDLPQLLGSLTLRLLMSYIYIYIYIYGAPILDVSRSHTTTQHSR